MIERNKFQINYIKKENQSGSYQGLRFSLQKADDKLLVTIYPEPYCLEATPDENKQSQNFELSNEGLDDAIQWLNETYESKKEYWTEAYDKRMDI